MGEQEALTLRATERSQTLELLDTLDALRCHGEAERGAHVEDGAHEGRTAAVGTDAAHEGAVDLHDVDWEPLEVVERGVAGAEVVECDDDAGAA